jgi:probable rRNA maturation factor
VINFFKESVIFRFLNKSEIQKWILGTVKKEKKSVENLNIIFCSDKNLRKINKTYLKHDYFTDIVTFDNSTSKSKIEGDIFISVDRVKINAKTYGVSFKDELHRVMIHGVLHLLGYTDKNVKSQQEMRLKEDHYLSKRNF